MKGGRNVRWAYDEEYGWVYLCPTCKTFLCMNEKRCPYCFEKLSWDKEKVEEYKGKVKWR